MTLMLVLVTVTQVQAVLKEKSLSRTLGVLKLELQNTHARQKRLMAQYEQQSQVQHAQLVEYMQQSEQIGLILYSQNAEFTFDVAYACQEATDLYRKLSLRTLPFDKIKERFEEEIARYDSLIYALEQLPPSVGMARNEMTHDEKMLLKFDNMEDDPFLLSKNEQKDRKRCLEYAIHLKGNLTKFLTSLEKDNRYYQTVKSKVERQNAYAQQKYKDLQQNIFINGGQSYITILFTLPRQLARISNDFTQKYMPLGSPNYSEWRGMVVLFSSVFMLIYIFIAAVLSNVLLRWVLPKVMPVRFKDEDFRKKRPILIMAVAILIFAVVVMILRMFVIKHNLMLMATELMINIAWLLEAVYISLLIRLNGNQIKHGAKIYTPFLLMSFIVIWFRIVLIPNSLVNLICPPILLAFTIWQSTMLAKTKKKVPASDKIYCTFSLATMLISCVMSWMGFTLMAVQVMIWWMFQLAAIASITSCYDLMEMYENKVLEKRIKKDYGDGVSDDEIRDQMRKGIFVDKTWIYDFVNRVLVPICGVASVFLSVYLASSVFEIRDLCVDWFKYDIIQESFLQMSMFKLCTAIASFFVFRYIEYLLRSVYFRYRRNNSDGTFNETLAKNIIAILVWGIYIISILYLLKVPRSGIQYVLTGLSAGLGFASKDILENFIYGLSLMTGRVRVGDYVECDGITGKVESISYQSTQIITLDGSVIAFLNSQLFSKNFKNLTRNHEYELVKIPFGVAYGSNVESIRKMIVEGISTLCVELPDGRSIVNADHPISVAFSDFGDNSVDLLLIAWVLVDQKPGFVARAKERIYNVLNENNIEIPFPQRDVYIRSITNSEQI